MLSAGVGLLAEMVAAHADGGDALAGGAEFAVDHVGGLGAFDRGRWTGRSVRVARDCCGYAGGGCGLEKVPSFHGCTPIGRGSTALSYLMQFEVGGLRRRLAADRLSAIGGDGGLLHELQGHVVFCGGGAAVFELGCGVEDFAVARAEFDADVAVGCG